MIPRFIEEYNNKTVIKLYIAYTAACKRLLTFSWFSPNIEFR